MAKKSWPMFYIDLLLKMGQDESFNVSFFLYKMGQDFLDMQYAQITYDHGFYIRWLLI